MASLAVASVVLLGGIPGASSALAGASCSLSGAGTDVSPYLVADAAGLASVGVDGCTLDADYEQTADITLSAPIAPAVSNHTPIGTTASPFTGTYDGRGYFIANLTVSSATADPVGLFGVTHKAVITGVGLVDVDVSAEGNAGALVGDMAAGSVTKSYATGTVGGGSNTGGLVGYVSAENPDGSGAPAAITASYASVDVSGDFFGGGLVGYTWNGSITDSYATGDVAPSYGGGGLVGGFSGVSDVTSSYATGVPSGTVAGALAGESCVPNSTFTDSFGSGDADLIGDPCPPDTPTLVNTSVKTPTEMTDIATFTNWDIVDGWEPFDAGAGKIWGICELANDGRPFLLWQYETNPCIPSHTVTFDPNGGSGSMSPQTAAGDTALTANAFTRDGYTFTGWNTDPEGLGTAYDNEALYPFTEDDTLFAQWALSRQDQVPADGCVKAGTTTSIPRKGMKRLMNPGCITNLGQPVGVRASVVAPRGDLRTFRLVCSVDGATTRPVAAGYGKGYKVCTEGSMKIRTFGNPLRITVTWFAPRTDGGTVYRFSQNYRT